MISSMERVAGHSWYDHRTSLSVIPRARLRLRRVQFASLTGSVNQTTDITDP